jgi:hypothetical protein
VGTAAALGALGFRHSYTEQLKKLSDSQWRDALAFCDRAGLTLLLGSRRREDLPEFVQRRTEANLEANGRRVAKLKQVYFQIADSLESLGIDHILLKGFLQAPYFVPSPLLKAQYDLDLLCPPADVQRARQALVKLGFEAMSGKGQPRADHLPPMTRKTGWLWKGNYFDPEMPPVVELHFRLWDPATERFEVDGLNEFPARVVSLLLDGRAVPGFCQADQLGYAAIHVLRHLLRGDLKACHVYELAFFLENHGLDDAFWRHWEKLHSPALRSIQTTPLMLAHRWFGSVLPDAVRVEAEKLPRPVRSWLHHYAGSPILSQLHPNKDELWLHLALLSGNKNKAGVLWRRLLPLNPPGQVEAVFVPEQEMTNQLRLLKRIRYVRFVLSRVVFHARSLASIFVGVFRWRRLKSEGSFTDLN